MPSLPYPDYSWSMNQHVEPVSNPSTIYKLLRIASDVGAINGYQNEITRRMMNENVLTANVRADVGRPQAWRDYQQVIAELGLIVSTRFTRNRGAVITPMGLMFLDGSIGYSETITTQVLKYQYPNGQKLQISSSVRESLSNAGIEIPRSRVILDAVSGVLVKPAVLILRVLLMHYEQSRQPSYLTEDECLFALMSVSRNSDWEIALNNLNDFRAGNLTRPSNLSEGGERRSKRHIQEWFRLLAFSDLFQKNDNGLSLSPVAISNLEYVTQLCEFHENPDTFWFPISEDNTENAWSWFNYFGAPNLESEWMLPTIIRDDDYLSENYPSGIESLEDDFSGLSWGEEALNLQPFDFERQEPQRMPVVNVGNVRRGHERRQRSTELHERTVKILARRFSDMAFDVREDRQSADLLVSRDGLEAIVEVKTTTRNNFNRHVRLGVGQLSEYRFRRERERGVRPKALLAVSSNLNTRNWICDYFQNDIEMGLISVLSENQIVAHTSNEIETLLVL